MDNGASSYRRFLDGDESGFEEIIDAYQANLIFFINRYVHNLTVAEDLAADVFAMLIVHPKRYNFSVSLKTYLFMIGKSRAIDWLRRESKFAKVSESFMDEKKEYRSLEDMVIANEEKKKINAVMDTLKDEYKMVLHLIYFEQFSYIEAGKVMRKTKKQVENLIYRAKKALRSKLEMEELTREK